MTSMPTEQNMRKRDDSAADLIWREKLDSCGTSLDAALVVGLLLLLLFVM